MGLNKNVKAHVPSSKEQEMKKMKVFGAAQNSANLVSNILKRQMNRAKFTMDPPEKTKSTLVIPDQ